MAWTKNVTTYQWLVLFVAWLGWVFDAMDATIYAIVLHPALHELLQAGAAGGEVTSEQIGWYGGIVFSIFLIGRAIGGFGMAADYFGRTKTLIATILIYAVFTGLIALAVPHSYAEVLLLLPVLGFFNNGILAAFRFTYPSCIRRGSVPPGPDSVSTPAAYSPPRHSSSPAGS